MLPDGQTVLFTLRASAGAADAWDTAQIVVQSLKTGARKTLLEGGSDARYLPTGHIVYALGGVLFAVPFDLRRLEIEGGPVPIVEGTQDIKRDSAVQRRRGSAVQRRQQRVADVISGPTSLSEGQLLAFVDRKGAVEPLKIPAGPLRSPTHFPER